MSPLRSGAEIPCSQSLGIGEARRWGCHHRATGDKGIAVEGLVNLARGYERRDLEHISWHLCMVLRMSNEAIGNNHVRTVFAIWTDACTVGP